MKIKYQLVPIVISIIIITVTVISINVFSKQPSLELTVQNNIDINSSDTTYIPAATYIPTASPIPAEQPQNLSMPHIIKFPKSGFPVLMYHSISTVTGNSLCVPEKQFSQEMEWLYQQDYHTLTMEKFYQALVNDVSIPEKSILLTFDDGYVDNYKAAWPILHKYGFTATFFIITKNISPKALDWIHLEELVREGNSIGSHTVRHFDLSTLSAEKQKSELSDSKQILEERLGISIKALCFPSGKYNTTTLKIMPSMGYELGFTTQPGKVYFGDDALTLKRVRVSAGVSITDFQKLLLE